MQIHSHDYKGDDPDFFRDKTVVVLGMGNSAMDIAVEASFVADPHLPRRPPRRAHPPEVHLRQADRPDRRLPADPVRGPPQGHAGDAQGLPGRHGALRPAQARPPLRRRPPDGLRRHPLADGARHDHCQAEHRLADPRRRALHRRVGGRGRHRRVLHRLQGHVPVLRRGLHLRPGQRPAAVPPHVPPRHPERVLHRSAAAARRDHADRRAPVDVGGRLPRGPLRAAVPGRAAGRHRARAARDVQALRRLQAPHDADRLRRLPGRAGQGAQGGRGARARRRAAAVAA